MAGEAYEKRLVEDALALHLRTMGAVLIEGPRGCGKTTTARRFSRSVLRVDDPRTMEDTAFWAELAPERLLTGAAPCLIDEWEHIPTIWDDVRSEVDRRSDPGQFILTGSAEPVNPGRIFHSGTGRFARMRMRPMTLFESGESTGVVSLRGLFEGRFEACADMNAGSGLTREALAYAACRGGWPASVVKTGEAALSTTRRIVRKALREAAARAAKQPPAEEALRGLLRVMAQHAGTTDPVTKLHRELADERVSLGCFRTVLGALRDTFVTEDLDAWTAPLRTAARLFTTPERSFCDPSFVAVGLGLTPGRLLRDRTAFGKVFRALCLRDLRVCADLLEGGLAHWRDRVGRASLVVTASDGRYGLVAVSPGGGRAEERNAGMLRTMAAKINVERRGTPSFLMVLTADGRAARRREDGVWVVPVGCFGP